MKYLVYGDLSGHAAPFYESLKLFGFNMANMRLPHNINVVQVGDLIDKGPDGDELIDFTYRAISTNGRSRWIQLVGNHEAMRLNGPQFFGRGNYGLTRESALKLQEMFYRRMMNIAAHIPGPATTDLAKNPGYVITHAGISFDVWKALQRPREGWEVTDKANDARLVEMFAPGRLLSGEDWGYPAGPVWATCVDEVYATWEAKDRKCPFHQIHGHSTRFNYNNGKRYGDMPMETFRKERKTLTVLNEMEFWAVDPGLGAYAAPGSITPLVIEDGIVKELVRV